MEKIIVINFDNIGEKVMAEKRKVDVGWKTLETGLLQEKVSQEGAEDKFVKAGSITRGTDGEGRVKCIINIDKDDKIYSSFLHKALKKENKDKIAAYRTQLEKEEEEAEAEAFANSA